MTGRAWRIVNLLHVNDLATADAEFAVYAQRVATLRQPWYQWRVLLFRAMRALLVGQFAEGEAFAHQAAALGQQVQPEVAAESCATQLFFVRQEQQRLHELAPLWEGVAAQHPRALGLRSALALLYWELGRAAEARRAFAALAADQLTHLPRNATWLDGICLLAVVCAGLGDAHHAHRLYALLHPYAGQSLVLGQVGAMLHLGAISRYLGLLAATMGHWAAAEAHYVAALATNAQLGARPWVAYTQYEYAQMLLARQGAGVPRPRPRTALLRLGHRTRVGHAHAPDQNPTTRVHRAGAGPPHRWARHAPATARDPEHARGPRDARRTPATPTPQGARSSAAKGTIGPSPIVRPRCACTIGADSPTWPACSNSRTWPCLPSTW